jgi:probable HAF family extracellular repeat protein
MVVGASDYEGMAFSPQHAFLYSGGQTTDLGTFPPGYEEMQSGANAINDGGQVVGVSDTKSGAQHAFLYSNGKMSDLGSVGGNSNALGINNAGEIIGTTSNSAFIVNPLNAQNPKGANTLPDQAWIYVNGKMIDIGDGAAQAINQAGEVVGTSDGFAFLYVNGKMIDLNSLLPENSGWQLQDATAINNYGVVVGEGTYKGQERAFVLYTTPEPVPSALLGVGIVCLGLIRKRYNQHSNPPAAISHCT